MGSAVEETQRKARQTESVRSGYYIVSGGEFENQQRAMTIRAIERSW